MPLFSRERATTWSSGIPSAGLQSGDVRVRSDLVAARDELLRHEAADIARWAKHEHGRVFVLDGKFRGGRRLGKRLQLKLSEKRSTSPLSKRTRWERGA